MRQLGVDERLVEGRFLGKFLGAVHTQHAAFMGVGFGGHAVGTVEVFDDLVERLDLFLLILDHGFREIDEFVMFALVQRDFGHGNRHRVMSGHHVDEAQVGIFTVMDQIGGSLAL